MNLPSPIPGPAGSPERKSLWAKHFKKPYQNTHHPPASKRTRSPISLAVYSVLLLAAIGWTAHRLLFADPTSQHSFTTVSPSGMLADQPLTPTPYYFEDKEGYVLVRLDDALESPSFSLDSAEDDDDVGLMEGMPEDGKVNLEGKNGKMVFVTQEQEFLEAYIVVSKGGVAEEDVTTEELEELEELAEVLELEVQAKGKCPAGFVDEVIGYVFGHGR
ncbi:hypothetical protein QBC43DRAFT_295078 [Cladorrhinum sp. PSN259]|nr:hypothetical protein QBC43DRAFT_295078 [Cladorrhinum sp. PSN259]